MVFFFFAARNIIYKTEYLLKSKTIGSYNLISFTKFSKYLKTIYYTKEVIVYQTRGFSSTKATWLPHCVLAPLSSRQGTVLLSRHCLFLILQPEHQAPAHQLSPMLLSLLWKMQYQSLLAVRSVPLLLMFYTHVHNSYMARSKQFVMFFQLQTL